MAAEYELPKISSSVTGMPNLVNLEVYIRRDLVELLDTKISFLFRLRR